MRNRSEIIFAGYPESKDAIIAVLNRNRVRKHDEGFFTWKYLHRPGVFGKPIVLFCHIKETEYAGSLTSYPVMKSTEVAGGCTVYHVGDISVDEPFRRRGIALAMIQALTNESASNGFHMSIPNLAAYGVLQKAGWRRVTRLRCLTLFLKIELYTNKPILSYLQKTINSVLYITHRALTIRKEDQYVFEEMKSLDSRFDELWRVFSDSSQFMFCRNKDFYEWRYIKRPNTDYRIFGITEEGVLKGCIVLLNQEKNILIVDMMYFDHTILSAMLKHTIRHIIKTGCKNIDILINLEQKDTIRVFMKNGFIMRRVDWDVLGYSSNGTRSDNAFMNGNNWFMTAGDKDI